MSKVNVPKVYKSRDMTTLVNAYANPNNSTPYFIPGFVIYNPATGNRSKVRNIAYERVKMLRGNQPKLQYRFMELRKTRGNIAKFLLYYPEYQDDFNRYIKEVHVYTNSLWLNYLKCFIKHEITLKEAPIYLKHAMFDLHKKYINELRPADKSINRQMTIEYVNNLPEAKLMHFVNMHYKIKINGSDTNKHNSTMEILTNLRFDSSVN
jgi:hypothetical protein